MSVIKLDKEKLEQFINGEKTVLIDFYADWCGPCRMMAPIVEEISAENPEIVVGKINVDDEPELAQSFGVSSIPTLVAIKGGKIIAQSVGARPKQYIIDMLNP